MPDHEVARSSTTSQSLPVAPSFGPGLAAARVRRHDTGVTPRVVYLCVLAVALRTRAGCTARPRPRGRWRSRVVPAYSSSR